MSNYAAYIAVMAQALSDDSGVNSLVDAVVPGFSRDQADKYLEGVHKCCIGIWNASINSEGLPGVAYHGLSLHEQLVALSLIHISDNDEYLGQVTDAVQNVLRKPIQKTLNGISYSFSTYRPINFSPVLDDKFSDRIELSGTCRIKYLDS
jgi:hypothetical protein